MYRTFLIKPTPRPAEIREIIGRRVYSAFTVPAWWIIEFHETWLSINISLPDYGTLSCLLCGCLGLLVLRVGAMHYYIQIPFKKARPELFQCRPGVYNAGSALKQLRGKIRHRSLLRAVLCRRLPGCSRGGRPAASPYRRLTPPPSGLPRLFMRVLRGRDRRRQGDGDADDPDHRYPDPWSPNPAPTETTR